MLKYFPSCTSSQVFPVVAGVVEVAASEHENTVAVKFMKRRKTMSADNRDTFYWPERDDVDVLKPEEILCKLQPPTPVSRRAADYIFDKKIVKEVTGLQQLVLM